MQRTKFLSAASIAWLALATAATDLAHAQVGKSVGIIDPNTAVEKDLLALPHMTPVIVKGLMDKRPFLSQTDFDAYLGQSLNPEQRKAVYGKTFVHLNLNTTTREEILMIPNAGARMVREFFEYRPFKSLTQFEKEIGKYVDKTELARLEQYVFVPVNLNTASDEAILSIPGTGARMLREFKEYRPYKTMAQFEKEIGKYVDKKEVARLQRFVTID